MNALAGGVGDHKTDALFLTVYKTGKAQFTPPAGPH